MKLSELIKKMDGARIEESLTRKRFACARCGNTWIELVGHIIARNDGEEDLCLRIGADSEICKSCSSHFRECNKCGSKDVYEVLFRNENPLSFKEIRQVFRNTG